jgi:hypothetical protein
MILTPDQLDLYRSIIFSSSVLHLQSEQLAPEEAAARVKRGAMHGATRRYYGGRAVHQAKTKNNAHASEESNGKGGDHHGRG